MVSLRLASRGNKSPRVASQACEMALHELADRGADGLRVRLLWDSGRDQAVLRYRDVLRGDAFSADVPNNLALDAFYHPNAYRPTALVQREAA
jgi:hypothetical protein